MELTEAQLEESKLQLKRTKEEMERWYAMFLESPSPSNWTLFRHHSKHYQYWFNYLNQEGWML